MYEILFRKSPVLCRGEKKRAATSITAFEMTQNILLVEDDADLVQGLRLHIEELGYALDHAADGERGAAMALERQYVLVILDVNLPLLNGYEVLKQIRAEKPAQPVLMLSARSEEIDRVVGFELGADDYVAKPFSVRELMLRLQALIRRASLQQAPPQRPVYEIRIGEIVLDQLNREVTAHGNPVRLTMTEFDLLAFLMSHPERVFSRDELLEKVWGYYSAAAHGDTVNAHVSRVRNKIERDPKKPQYIQTVWGVGYKFIRPATE